MRVTLAGYNVDAAVLEEARQRGVDPDTLTPEPISAAYARISRYNKPVGELRRVARGEVAKARRSNQRIIWEMGHHSVAEHAVFNFDLVGLSRLAIEAVEQFRLCSFTEKSQRYITLDGDFVRPTEIDQAGLGDEFVTTIEQQNALYSSIHDRILASLVEAHPEQAARRPGMRLLAGQAKEDARYATALATEGQLGLTVNARNLELVVRRFAAHPLHEVRTLGEALYREVSQVAPSLILFTDPCDLDRRTYPELAGRIPAGEVAEQAPPGALDDGALDNGTVRLVQATADADTRLTCALLHTVSGESYATCWSRARGMDDAGRRELLATSMRHLELFDAVLREFEHVGATFEITLSAACFGQLKRHRMMTPTSQPYDAALGVTVPPAVEAVGLGDALREVARASAALAARIADRAPAAAPYALTNAHRRRVLVTTNARELYHLSRLREDHHAQWDIRAIAAEMIRQAREVMPATLMLTGGKDVYAARYEALFGEPPKVSGEGGVGEGGSAGPSAASGEAPCGAG